MKDKLHQPEDLRGLNPEMITTLHSEGIWCLSFVADKRERATNKWTQSSGATNAKPPYLRANEPTARCEFSSELSLHQIPS